MTHEVEFNARSVPPTEIARSFVPPEGTFARLLSRNHVLMLGPRGSGKTTLLKMLTARALRVWEHPQAISFSKQVTFNAALIQADVAWGRQLEALQGLAFKEQRREAAFVLHTLRALVFAMREAVELARSNPPVHVAHLAVEMSSAQEESFVAAVSGSLEVDPPLRTMLGLELGLEAKLNSINKGTSGASYTSDSLPSTISLLISAFNGLSSDPDRRWGLLFDELEIAPPRVQQFLLSGVRSFDDRVVIKLAMAPYMEDVGFQRSPTSPQPLHDYQTITLSYPNKEEAADFTRELFQKTLQRLGVEADAALELFQISEVNSHFGRRGSTQRERHAVPTEFFNLASKDESFRDYMSKRGLFSKSYAFTERNVASDIRKVLPIVIARDYYLRQYRGNHVVANRSRKTHDLYTGIPAIMEITEGNPRAILTLLGPLMREYRAANEGQARRSHIPMWLQNRAVRRVELLVTSLLQVIPLDLGGFEPGKGLLDFVDQIGRAFEERLLRRPFAPDYVGTFIVDDNVTPAVIAAVGRGLNAGAFVHVPHPNSGPDVLLRGFANQRFRISYALAARYRLLLTLGDRINLSSLLLEGRGAARVELQASLFDEEVDDPR